MPAPVTEFHAGERAMHSLLHVPRQRNPTSSGLPPQYAARATHFPLVAVGTVDAAGRPWTTLWGGDRGCTRPIARGVLAFVSAVDVDNDPVVEALWDGAEVVDGEILRPGTSDAGRLMSALAIDLETRDRVKFAGRMVAGTVDSRGTCGAGWDVQLAMQVSESLGNCPKYLNCKDIVPAGEVMKPVLVSAALPLPKEAIGLIATADMLFLSTTSGEAMDTNHRGGNPGFVRVLRNTADVVQLVYPEFSGNRLYQSLGNLKLNPMVGIVIPGFESGDVLYLTGAASILVGHEASSLMPKTQLAVKISVTAAKFIKSGLPFRGTSLERSPYNPPIRHLLAEHDAHIASSAAAERDTVATLVRRETLTPTINRFTFHLSSRTAAVVPTWHAGQYATLDFDELLSAGYSHMRDEDPQSLNDDHVRTFTVSSPPASTEMQITVRLHGPVTHFLWAQQPDGTADADAQHAPVRVPVLGFGGAESYRIPTDPSTASAPVFIAAGVGITPLLAQAPALLAAGRPLQVLWTLRAEDLALAVDAFAVEPRLAVCTTLFVTGGADGEDMGALAGGAAVVRPRRLQAEDVHALKGKGSRFFLCTGPALLAALVGWLQGEHVVWEDFGY
ncbi:uncharacterized protein EV422DRAFT_36988 [Fimicolochytrium jonesii]|uniref:uncharacterized protein n=1 Tax=Fimicolochytrium jonesii TaxID=1396493 RepID=UPI0022FE2324|nr:uncharacterized protein EV422DRAFT_36988 [Fimicolochytrium jonesii]KAI8821303.1 hypothetical protein EV422DRAFT_36988 [Fimicolochytrium jonesii]